MVEPVLAKCGLPASFPLSGLRAWLTAGLFRFVANCIERAEDVTIYEAATSDAEPVTGPTAMTTPMP